MIISMIRIAIANGGMQNTIYQAKDMWRLLSPASKQWWTVRFKRILTVLKLLYFVVNNDPPLLPYVDHSYVYDYS